MARLRRQIRVPPRGPPPEAVVRAFRDYAATLGEEPERGSVYRKVERMGYRNGETRTVEMLVPPGEAPLRLGFYDDGVSYTLMEKDHGRLVIQVVVEDSHFRSREPFIESKTHELTAYLEREFGVPFTAEPLGPAPGPFR